MIIMTLLRIKLLEMDLAYLVHVQQVGRLQALGLHGRKYLV